MANVDKDHLATLYTGSDINLKWGVYRDQAIIDHPTQGKISPNQYRAQYHNRPCPFCGQKMFHGPQHSTPNKSDAIARGYQYVDQNGKKRINFVGNPPTRYFHPHYVTLDHKINKARCPELMFDYDNLQIMCWKCNSEKSDNNAYELQHTRQHIQSLSQETLQRYPTL